VGKPPKGPPKDGRLRPCPDKPNCVSSQSPHRSHRVDPIPFQGDPGEAMATVRAAVESMPGARVVTATDAWLHAEFTSRVFRFVDDLEALLDPDEGVIHVTWARTAAGWRRCGRPSRRRPRPRADPAGGTRPQYRFPSPWGRTCTGESAMSTPVGAGSASGPA